MEITTTDTYEAAWYLYHHAIIDKITKKRLQDHKANKRGYRFQFTFYITGIRTKDFNSFKNAKAYANVIGYKLARLKLKRLMRRDYA
jgi:hypothetical protein